MSKNYFYHQEKKTKTKTKTGQGGRRKSSIISYGAGVKHLRWLPLVFLLLRLQL